MSETTDDKPSSSKSDFLHDYLQKTDLSNAASLNQYVKDHQITRDENETDEAFTKRVKKINYLNLAQQLIRHSNQTTHARQITKTDFKPIEPEPPSKSTAPLKRMKPVFSPAEDPDFDDEFEIDEQNSRDIYDQSSSSSSSSSDEDEEIHLRQRHITPSKSNHTFANDIKQKLSSLAADVVRTFGASNTTTLDDDLTKPFPNSSSFSSRLFPNRTKESKTPIDEEKADSDTDRENNDADLLYSNESLLPQVDWENLEKQLKEAQVERERYEKMDLYTYYLYNDRIKFEENLDLKARLNDRDEIRRKLAAGNESEGENDDYYTSDYIKKTMVTSSHRRRQGSNLQICFVNEHHQASESSDNDGTSGNSKTKLKTSMDDKDDILTKQKRLKEEAKVALALGAKMARMQVQIERRALRKKKSPLYDIIGINANGDKPLSRRLLEDMNIGQLQVIVNDLHCQIENLNDELVKLLMNRDSLSMEQDSILVDIEDLTKRLQERAADNAADSSRMAKNGTAQRVYIVKSPPTPPTQDVQKRSLLHNLLRKATFI